MIRPILHALIPAVLSLSGTMSLAVAAASAGDTNAVIISNREPRRDSEGNIIDAHDGCLMRFGDRYYLYGTRYGDSNGFNKGNLYVCYSSPDLVHWTNHGVIVQTDPNGVYYRPYVLFNGKTNKYVLWYNADGHYGVATADKPEGPFTLQHTAVKVGNPVDGDLGLFKDDDGSAYLAYSANGRGHFDVSVEPIPHHQIFVEKLAPDYLSSTMECSQPVAGNCESPALFKRNGIYYLLFDNTCCFGKDGSGARVYTSDKPLGPYRYRGNINVKTPADPASVPVTWTKPGSGRPDCVVPAQQTHVAALPTAAGTAYLWMGDRWHSSIDKIKGHDFQYWSSPLQFDSDGMIRKLTWEDQWFFDTTR